MDMFRHHYISTNIEPIPMTNLFQSFFEDIPSVSRSQQRFAMVTTERDEVKTPSFLKPLQSPRHTGTLYGFLNRVCDE